MSKMADTKSEAVGGKETLHILYINWTVFTADSRYASQVAISTPPGYTEPV